MVVNCTMKAIMNDEVLERLIDTQMENFSGQLKKYKVTINDLLAERCV